MYASLVVAWTLSVGARALSPGAIVVLGAAGRTGVEVVHDASARGYPVVGLARSARGESPPPGASVCIGDATCADDVRACFEEARAKGRSVAGAVVALGGNTRDVGKTMLRDSTANVLAAMRDVGCKRIAVITSAGTGDSYEQAPLFFRGLMATMYRDMFDDKNAQEHLLTSPAATTTCEWCIVRPGGLTSAPATGVTRVVRDEVGSIARADVARFCVDAVTDAKFPYVRQAVCISNGPAVRDHN